MNDITALGQPLPWHEDLWRQVIDSQHADRMAHGLLICGPPGTGRRHFAARLAKALVCHSPEAGGDACGACPGCRQWQAQSHPDVSILTPEEAGGVIKVGRVREFTRQLQLTSQYASGRLGWIEPAEQLHNAAANSLLKTLEEPPAGTHLILVSGYADRLLPTIRSRCRILRVPPAPVRIARDWLAARDVALDGMDDDALRMPLRVLERPEDADELEAEWRKDLAAFLAGRKDVVALAEHWSKQPPERLLEWLYRTLCAVFARKLDASQPVAAQLADASNGAGLQQLQSFCAGVARAGRLRNTNADWQLVLESVLRTGARP